jgi:hypothetical protein
MQAEQYTDLTSRGFGASVDSGNTNLSLTDSRPVGNMQSAIVLSDPDQTPLETAMAYAMTGKNPVSISPEIANSQHMLQLIQNLPPSQAQSLTKQYIMSLPNPSKQLDAFNDINSSLPYDLIDLSETVESQTYHRATYGDLYKFLGIMGPSKASPFYAKLKYPKPDLAFPTDLMVLVKTNPDVVWNTLINLYSSDYTSGNTPLYGLIGDARMRALMQMVQDTINDLSNPVKLSQALQVRPMQQYRIDKVRRDLAQFNLMYGVTPETVFTTGLIPAYSKASKLVQQDTSRGLPPQRPLKPEPLGPLEGHVPDVHEDGRLHMPDERKESARDRDVIQDMVDYKKSTNFFSK